MKRVLLVFGVIALLMSGVYSYAQEIKIGHIDFFKVLGSYEKTGEYESNLEKLKNKKKEQLETMDQELQKMKEGLELLNDKAREKEEKKIEKKEQEMMQFDRDSVLELRKMFDDRRKEIVKDIQSVVEKYGNENGYTFIVDSNVLFYGGEDVSEEIISRLNKN